MVTSMTIDVSPENKRTNNVFMVFIPELITGIIGPPIGAWLLSWSLWAALISGTAVLLLAFAVMGFSRRKPRKGNAAGETTDPACITYNWSLAQVSNVLPLLAVLNLGFAFALPRLADTIRTASGLTSWEVDWALSVGSVLPLVVGAVVIGLWQTMGGTITGLVIQTAGYGNRLFLLSLLPSMVPADTLAQLYMMLSLVDTIGGFARSTLMETLFGLSLGLRGRGTGLPFMVSAVGTSSLRTGWY
ncbi:uncharacterized protein B0H64DRAFT_145610 [Chaetomium fimeti]|uniref:Major facilitator superfamily (MFS) profile domain-containing protein n=1 Tax=Chaetomium fimeti TaxID=1854472 RepID=A0AAE0HF53_9PEZI|nr:hypothetical protein B0H64DRAFT_145610 [Chaetomium fimeti]